MTKEVKNEIFSFSENGRKEYCASVVRIGELHPIEGSDFLCRTVVYGFDVVVRKDEVNTGDLMLYAQNETMLNSKFLSANNLFELGEYERNANKKEVGTLIEQDKKDEARRLVGFFNKHGRVKMIRLRGCPSIGFLFGVDALAKWKPELANINLEQYVGTDFDTVCGELFIKVYMPPQPPVQERKSRQSKYNKRLNRFDRIIPGEFVFHYDTDQLNNNVQKISPNDKICISVKVHGTSAIFSNVKVKKPLHLNVVQKILNKSIRKRVNRGGPKRLLSKLAPKHTIGYGNVYSSRGVIKNKYINKEVSSGFYESDVWGDVNKWMWPHLPKGISVYGEIVGYLTGSDKMIQKGYDYGCEVGTNKFMPYRITQEGEDGRRKEWEVSDIYKWTMDLIKEHPDLAGKLMPIHILYSGKALDMYPDIDIAMHWHENFLAALKNDKDRLGMEENEPMCKNKVPREGICLRIVGDKIAECFKLKTDAYRMREQKEIDAGNVDIESALSYST